MTTDQDQTPVAALARQHLDDAAVAYKAGQQKLVETSALLSIAASLVWSTELDQQALDIAREGWAQNAQTGQSLQDSRDQILDRLKAQNDKLDLMQQILDAHPQSIAVERVAQGCGCAPTQAPGYAVSCKLCTTQTWVHPGSMPEGWTSEKGFTATAWFCPEHSEVDGDEL